MKRHLFQLALPVVLSLVHSFTPVYGAEWRQYGSGNNMDLYYDAKSVSYLSRDSLRVLNKFVVQNDNGRLRMIKERAKKNLFIEGYENYKESNVIYEIKCSTQELYMLSATDYDKMGDILDSTRADRADKTSNPGWDFIIPGTPTGLLPEAVCKKGVNNK